MVQPNSENLLLNGTSPIFCSADLFKNPCRFTVGISLIDPGRLMLSIATKDTTWFRIGSVCFGDGASSNHGTGESEQPLQKHQVFPFQIPATLTLSPKWYACLKSGLKHQTDFWKMFGSKGIEAEKGLDYFWPIVLWSPRGGDSKGDHKCT